jgi:hypothetical protein
MLLRLDLLACLDSDLQDHKFVVNMGQTHKNCQIGRSTLRINAI